MRSSVGRVPVCSSKGLLGLVTAFSGNSRYLSCFIRWQVYLHTCELNEI